MTLTDDLRRLRADMEKLEQRLAERLGGIEANVEKCRAENKEEGRAVRGSIRNLGLTVLGSVGVLIAARLAGVA
jgi:hypothetical protein